MKPSLPLENKTVLVTGATDGIGRVTAETLSAMGAQVVIVSRNPEKTRQTAAAIQAKTGRAVEWIAADLSNRDGVRSAAQAFLERHDRLHVLVNNAVAVFMKRALSADGYEMTFALNHLAYFQLTHLLLDTLKASAPARIVNVSSAAHVGGSLDLDDLQTEKGFSGWKAYSRSKLANIYFTYELARRLEGTGVTANCLHPGFVATNFGRSNGGLFTPIFRLFQMGAISPEEGAQTSIYLASSPEVEGVTDKYFDKKKAVPSSPISNDPLIAARLWEASQALLAESLPVSA